MIWQEDLERIALLHFKYETFVLLEDDFWDAGPGLKNTQRPQVEKLQK